jgi:GNAT superfamily N-acetyltransferase
VTDAGGGPFFAIRMVPARATYPLRQRVLRPHQRPDQVAFPGDDDADSAHFAAFGDGVVAGVVSVLRRPPPWAPDLARAWRLRGMATDGSRRRLGIGAALLAEVVGHVWAAGGGLLWCQARTPALSFYRRGGFRRSVRTSPWRGRSRARPAEAGKWPGPPAGPARPGGQEAVGGDIVSLHVPER